MPGEIGCGVHVGWLNDHATRSEAVACDLLAPFSIFELRAEAFTGQALKGLGGGGIGQSLTTFNEPVIGAGGWAQLSVNPSPIWGFGAGCGVGAGTAHPRDDDPEKHADAEAEDHALVLRGSWWTLMAGAEFAAMELRIAWTTFRACTGSLERNRIAAPGPSGIPTGRIQRS